MNTITAVKDPVCGMDVDSVADAGQTEYKGQTYYFCSKGCKDTFDKEPGKYAAGAKTEHGHSH